MITYLDQWAQRPEVRRVYVRHRAGYSGHLAKWYTEWPDQDGRYPPCACHPAPNPAARDYRRRTKHRNRRRK